MKMQPKRYLAVLAAVATLTGCGQAPQPGAANPTATVSLPSPRAAQASPAAPVLGKLTVSLKWPNQSGLHTMLIPPSSTTGTITVSGVDMAEPVTATVGPDDEYTATLSVPTGANRTVVVTASNSTAMTSAGVATGITVTSGSNSPVSITMAPLNTPAISNVAPTNGGPTRTVTLSGANLVPPGTTSPSFSTPNTGNGAWGVKFNETSATISAWTAGTNGDPDTIICAVPSSATTGNVVVTADGVASASTNPFQVIQSITLSSTSLTLNAGATQTLTASAIDTEDDAVSFPVVTWSTTDSAVASISTSGVVTGVKGGTTTVTAGSGNVSAGTSASVAVKPTIVHLSASTTTVGATLTLTGQGYGSSQGSSAVTVGGQAASIVTWPGAIVVITVPSVAAGSQNVVITVGSQASTASAVTIAPAITSASPSPNTAGGSVTITGTSFGTSAGSLTIGGTSVTAGTWGDTSITATVPSSLTPGAANIVVTANSTASAAYALNIRPDISSLSDTSGAVGLEITIGGANFGSSQGSSSVTFNGTAAASGDIVSWGDTSIHVKVPSGASTGDLKVTMNGVASNSLTFTVTE